MMVSHNVIVGGHNPVTFEVAAPKGFEQWRFKAWSGECVPFLFEVVSAEAFATALNTRTTQEGVCYIASLCRRKPFHFKYFRHQDLKWSQIDRAEFSTTRALKNLWDWRSGGIKYSKATPRFIQDGLKRSDALFRRARVTVKPESYTFFAGLTARMWAHLESSVDFWAFDKHFSDEGTRQHAVAYSRKYSIK
jgi:hypothetical protein